MLNDKPLAEGDIRRDDDPLDDAARGDRGQPAVFRLSHVGLMNAGVTTEAVVAGAVRAVDQLMNVEVKRSEAPCSEFSRNGVRLMETFWYDFILGNGLHDFEGTISPGATRHLMQHYTLRFQANKGLVLLLANQAQRHRVLRSVSGTVKAGRAEDFLTMVSDPALLQILERAQQNPRSEDGKKVLKTISPMVSLCAKPVPWGAVERGSCIAQLLAMIRRYGPASLFLTIAPDDVHNPLGIRLTIRTRSTDTFPAVPGSFMQALRRQPSSLKCGDAESSDSEEIVFDETYKLEDFLQSQAAGHPASTSMMFDAVADTVLSTLCGTPPRRRERKTEKLSDRKKGIWGTGVASFAVVEETGRGAHHLHAAIWCGALPGLVSGAAIKKATFDYLRRELDKQFRSSIEREELLVLHAARRALHRVPLHRPEFHERPALLQEVPDPRPGEEEWKLHEDLKRTAEHTAVTRQWHHHTATCEKPPQGACGCRMCMPAGHPVCETRAVAVTSVPEIGEEQEVEDWLGSWPKKSWPLEGETTNRLSCGRRGEGRMLYARCTCWPRSGRSVLRSTGVGVWTSVSSPELSFPDDRSEPAVPSSEEQGGWSDDDLPEMSPLREEEEEGVAVAAEQADLERPIDDAGDVAQEQQQQVVQQQQQQQ